MDEDPGYQPGDRHSAWGPGRAATGCGCLAALIFAASVGFTVLLGIVLGDCMIDVPCHQNDRTYLSVGLAVVLALAALLGLAVRVLVRWSLSRGTGRAPGAWSLVWAIPVALVLGLLALWCALAIFGLA